jgi:transcriptional repressor NrdR
VSTELIDAAIERIEDRLLNLGQREIDSSRLGELVMDELKGLDKVGYIRFASVTAASRMWTTSRIMDEVRSPKAKAARKPRPDRHDKSHPRVAFVLPDGRQTL